MTLLTDIIAVHNFLVACAASGHTTNYEAVAVATGLPSSGNQLGSTLSPILGKIFRWCEANGMPPLTSIVVRKSGADAGLPGAGFWTLAYPARELNKVEKKMMTSVYQERVFTVYGALNQ